MNQCTKKHPKTFIVGLHVAWNVTASKSTYSHLPKHLSGKTTTTFVFGSCEFSLLLLEPVSLLNFKSCSLSSNPFQPMKTQQHPRHHGFFPPLRVVSTSTSRAPPNYNWRFQGRNDLPEAELNSNPPHHHPRVRVMWFLCPSPSPLGFMPFPDSSPPKKATK